MSIHQIIAWLKSPRVRHVLQRIGYYSGAWVPCVYVCTIAQILDDIQPPHPGLLLIGMDLVLLSVPAFGLMALCFWWVDYMRDPLGDRQWAEYDLAELRQLIAQEPPLRSRIYGALSAKALIFYKVVLRTPVADRTSEVLALLATERIPPQVRRRLLGYLRWTDRRAYRLYQRLCLS